MAPTTVPALPGNSAPRRQALTVMCVLVCGGGNFYPLDELAWIACAVCARIANQPIKVHEDVMKSGQRKKSRTLTKSGTGRAKAKNKTRRPSSKALGRTAEHVKKQSTKPRDTQRPRPATANGSAGHLNAISKGTSSPSTVVGMQTDIVAMRPPAAAIGDLQSTNAGLMAFSPLAMLLRQQQLLASIMLNAMQTQQHWARACSRLPWRTA